MYVYMYVYEYGTSDSMIISDFSLQTGGKQTSTPLIYKMSDNPIDDISFLCRKARTLCQNIPTYWAIPHCGDAQTDPDCEFGDFSYFSVSMQICDFA